MCLMKELEKGRKKNIKVIWKSDKSGIIQEEMSAKAMNRL